MVGLVPESLDDFRSVEFWDEFFEKRGSQPFEWYGEWPQLRPLAEPICKPDKRILVVGCGNSELSAQMYDAGITNITNIDFSKGVIHKMLKKNVHKRSSMLWRVMDMTQMTFEDGKFDVVMDKGGLDALMGEDTPDADVAGGRLLAEVARVLNPVAGTYLCVTLVQPHVLKKLLSAFREGWKVDITSVPPTPDMASSPLQPFLVTAARVFNRTMPDPQLHANSEVRNVPNAEQLADLEEVVKDEIRSRAHLHPAQTASPAGRPEVSTKGGDDFALLVPGRRISLTLGDGTPGKAAGYVAPKAGPGVGFRLGGEENERGYGEGESTPVTRFSAAVLDLDADRARAAKRPCAVFIVPQGREHEWLFGSEEGQWQVANQCGAARLIMLSLNRGHRFTSLEAVKKEASLVVLSLLPAQQRENPEKIEILSTDVGIGSRTVLEEADSNISGRIAVEDIVEGKGSAQRHLRRMVFLSNRGLIQSEGILVPPSALAPGEAKSQNGAVNAGKARGKKKNAKAMPEAVESSPRVVDPAQLAFEYQSAIVAGTALVSDAPSNRPWRALVVGVGGGPLPIYLNSQLGMHVTAVDLDPVVVELARRHFGLVESDTLEVRIQDGLVAVAEAAEAPAEEQLDLLIVDAGSADASQAMSCPPPPFLEKDFLENALRALRPGGVLAVNCVTRAKTALQAALAAVKEVFQGVCMRDIEDDVNCVVFATSAPLPDGLLKNGRTSLLNNLKAALGGSRENADLAALQAHLDSLTLS